MSMRRLAWLPILGALVLASCAGPARLAQLSDEALAKGDVRKAYDRALRAVEKDPLNAQARAAYTRASGVVADDYKARVRALAAADALGAANLVLEFRGFRNTVARHGSPLAADAGYEQDENRIVGAAAREFYRRGRADFAAKQPKQAWRDFGTCLTYVPQYQDAEKRQQDAWNAARTRVALLPFADGIQVRGLSEEIADQVGTQVTGHAGQAFVFTEIVPTGQVLEQISMAQAGRVSAESAVAIGRRIGADQVVTGRFAGLRSDNDLQYYTTPVYRRVDRKDDKGVTHSDWEESTLHVITRERTVHVNWEYEVIDVKTGAVVAHREVPSEAAARVVWTDFKVLGDPDRYSLLPPDVRRSDSDRAKRADQDWSDHLGSWKLAELLKHARDDRARIRWSSSYRGEFHGTDSRRRPVWLGALPGEDDLAFVALDDAWRPVFSTLQELDAQD